MAEVDSCRWEVKGHLDSKPLTWTRLWVELKRMLYNTAERLSGRGDTRKHTHTCMHTHVHTLTLVKPRLCKQARQMDQVVFLVCLPGKLLRSCQSCRSLTAMGERGGEGGTLCFCLFFSVCRALLQRSQLGRERLTLGGRRRRRGREAPLRRSDEVLRVRYGSS